MASNLTPEEKAAKKKHSLYVNFIKNTLRRASYRWAPRGEAEKASRVARGLYRCKQCELEGMAKMDYKRHEVELDHVEPVVPIETDWLTPEGEPDWNLYIKRLFCDQDGYQMICKMHHEIKTLEEDHMRAFYNAKRKEEGKKK